MGAVRRTMVDRSDRWWSAVVAAIVLVAAVPTPAAAEVPPGLNRLAGDDRVATAIEVSETVFPAGAGGYVLATADGYADALAGSVLAAQIGGPVLLTPSDDLPEPVLVELSRVGGGPSYIVGGPTAVAEPVGALTSAERVAGDDRYQTAAAIAAKVVELGAVPDTVYLTTGLGFADAVSAAGLAAAERAPILLADPGSTAAAAAFVAGQGVTRVVAVGGTAVLPDAVLSEVAGTASTDRLWGNDRYATSHAVAAAAVGAGASTSSVWVAASRGAGDHRHRYRR
jgi:putative cell wall-binding protein